MAIRDWLREQGVVGRGLTLDATARRVLDGEDFWFAVREFLDGVNLVAETGGDVTHLVIEEPVPLPDVRHDAYLAALAEHTAIHHGQPIPRWALSPERSCEPWWFPNDVRAFDATALAQSPLAFRRRGIFILAGALERC